MLNIHKDGSKTA